MSFGSGSSFDWTSMMNAELTAENRPAWVRFGVSVQYGDKNRTTHENEGCVQILVILFHVISVKTTRLPAVHSEKSVRESLVLRGSKNSLRADWMLVRCQLRLTATAMQWGGRTTLDLSGSSLGFEVEAFHPH